MSTRRLRHLRALHASWSPGRAGAYRYQEAAGWERGTRPADDIAWQTSALLRLRRSGCNVSGRGDARGSSLAKI